MSNLAGRPVLRPSLYRFHGDTVRLPLSLLDPDTGAAFNPTGKVLLFTCKADENDADADAKIQKISTVGGFTILVGATGSIEVELVPADFAAIEAGVKYECDVQAQDPAEGWVKTVQRFQLKFARDITRLTTLSIPTTVFQPDSALLWDNISGKPDYFPPDFTESDSPTVKRGEEDLSADDLSAAIAFESSFESPPRLIIAQVMKPTGGDNYSAFVDHGTITTDSFSVDLSAPIPSGAAAGDYKLVWVAYL